MYRKFYNLKENPFNSTCDPSFFFFSRKHKEALSHLHYGVIQKKGIITITGEIGTGKTTLCRFFLKQLDKKNKVAFLINPYFPEIQLLEAIASDFGIKKKNVGRFAYVWELNKFLINETEAGNNVILIIDEAQNLTVQQLEQVRLLSNFETQKTKLIQIVLTGQPELNRKLELYELRQLYQRITVKYHIFPLEKDEIPDYISHRLKVAGSDGKGIKFTTEALETIASVSSGTPRLINMICDRALLAGFAAGTQNIDSDIINKSVKEIDSYFFNPDPPANGRPQESKTGDE